jgi:hypothetical protein
MTTLEASVDGENPIEAVKRVHARFRAVATRS